MSVYRQGAASRVWSCGLCGGASDRRGLEDHLAWYLGSRAANPRMLDEMVARDGQQAQEALVAESKRRRAGGAAPPPAGRAHGGNLLH